MAGTTLFPGSLRSERLLLRPIHAGDAAAIFEEYCQDTEVTRFLTWGPQSDIAETRAHIARCMASDSSCAYVLTGLDDGGVMGALDMRDIGHGRIDCGYVLARRHWGRGLMTEALTTAADWALAQDSIWRIGAVCDTENKASARVMEKAGFTREGLLRRWIVHPSQGEAPRDCYIYSRVR